MSRHGILRESADLAIDGVSRPDGIHHGGEDVAGGTTIEQTDYNVGFLRRGRLF